MNGLPVKARNRIRIKLGTEFGAGAAASVTNRLRSLDTRPRRSSSLIIQASSSSQVMLANSPGSPTFWRSMHRSCFFPIAQARDWLRCPHSGVRRRPCGKYQLWAFRQNPAFKMNALWASDNLAAFVALRSSSREIGAENSSQKRSNLAASDQYLARQREIIE
jgi:hypothetical protein